MLAAFIPSGWDYGYNEHPLFCDRRKVFINNKKKTDFGFVRSKLKLNVSAPTLKQNKVSAFILKL